MAEGQGGLVRVDGLAIRVDPGRGVAGIPESRGCLGVAAGLPLVARDAREPRGVVAGRARRVESDASAMRRWSSRRRARLVDSSARSRSAPWVKS